jgi:hypothetical protein
MASRTTTHTQRRRVCVLFERASKIEPWILSKARFAKKQEKASWFWVGAGRRSGPHLECSVARSLHGPERRPAPTQNHDAHPFLPRALELSC